MSAAYDLVRFMDGINEVLVERDSVIAENKFLKQENERLNRQLTLLKHLAERAENLYDCKGGMHYVV